jgi:hypothetical protein
MKRLWAPVLNVSLCTVYSIIYFIRRKIRLREGNAKCRHLTKLTCNGTLRQVFIDWRQAVMLVISTQLCELLSL